MSFGLYLRKARGKRSQQEIADAAGIRQTYLSDLERDKARHPSREVLTGLASALGLPLVDMMKAAWGDLPPDFPNTDDLPPVFRAALARSGRRLSPRAWELLAQIVEGLGELVPESAAGLEPMPNDVLGSLRAVLRRAPGDTAADLTAAISTGQVFYRARPERALEVPAQAEPEQPGPPA